MTDELKAATVASSPWKQATLSINGNKVEGGAEPVLLRGRGNVVTVEAPPAIARELNLALPVDGGLNIVASPDFNKWVSPVNGKFTWTITPDAGKSGRITLVFFSREVTELWAHRSLVISSDLAEEVTVLLGGFPFPSSGADFIEGQTKTVSLAYKSGNLLAGTPLAFDWLPDAGLVEGDLACRPPLREFSAQHVWELTGTGIVSGTFKLKLFNEGQSTSLLTPTNRLLVRDKTIRVIQDNGDPLPLPPQVILIPANTDVPFAMEVKHSNGLPAENVRLTFPAGHNVWTDSRGRADFRVRVQQGEINVVVRGQITGSDIQAEAWFNALQ
ncbi:hypothetical protein [Pseudomonas sp. PDM27]|uniref:hypothetical protein n=1 Tax=Pseudomonas sp. PDM27 TaxID=2854769 RepID=UPI001C4578E5|nr:hypothetical protein [Pseudomonas sp. PDM27]MBV7570662.1 hypothetical protein [Pseudomonas sp. PDM27]